MSVREIVVTKPIGVIKGEGAGPEIIDTAISVIREVEKIKGCKFNFIEYDGPAPANKYTKEAHFKLKRFFEEIRDKKGVILHSAIYAAYLYRLRTEFNLLYKLIFLEMMPELLDVSLLKEEIAEKIRILLIRENSQGLYHGSERLQKTDNGERVVYGTFSYEEEKIRDIAKTAFEFAKKRNKILHLFIKDHVWLEIGKLWLEIFRTTNQEYLDVTFNRSHPDSGIANMFITPENFDVIVALDVDGDILSDFLAGLIYGTRGITPSSNINPDGFATFQTIHGTVLGLPPDTANPIGMIMAIAQMLELSFQSSKEARLILKAIRNVLSEGYRTVDIYRANFPNHKLVGTSQMRDLIIQAIQGLSVKENEL